MGIIKRNRINHKAFYRSLQAFYLTLRPCIQRKIKRITPRNSISFDFLYFTMNILPLINIWTCLRTEVNSNILGGGGTLCIELWLPFLVGVEKGLSKISFIGV